MGQYDLSPTYTLIWYTPNLFILVYLHIVPTNKYLFPSSSMYSLFSTYQDTLGETILQWKPRNYFASKITLLLLGDYEVYPG